MVGLLFTLPRRMATSNWQSEKEGKTEERLLTTVLASITHAHSSQPDIPALLVNPFVPDTNREYRMLDFNKTKLLCQTALENRFGLTNRRTVKNTGLAQVSAPAIRFTDRGIDSIGL